MQSILDNKKEESSAAEKIQKIRDKAASKNISYNLVYDSIYDGEIGELKDLNKEELDRSDKLKEIIIKANELKTSMSQSRNNGYRASNFYKKYKRMLYLIYILEAKYNKEYDEYDILHEDD